MFYKAKNKTIEIDETDLDYISFGTGDKTLVMIPGLGDGLRTVKGTAVTFSIMYRIFAKDFTVYMFSRKNEIPENYTTKEMARDTVKAMEKLGIDKAYVLGVSQGGMIAQHMAIDYPQKVIRLVLAVTEPRCNDVVRGSVGKWIELAENKDYPALFIDTAEKSYSENKLKKYRFFYPILTKVGAPKDLKRFIIQANACLQHHTYESLDRICCKTLIIGGGKDQVVGFVGSKELKERIPDSSLIVYEELGHMTFEEAKDFNDRVKNFFLQ